MPLSDLEELFTSIPTIARFINGRVTKFDNETLREVVRRILSSSDEEITEVYTGLRKTPIAKFGKHSYIRHCFLV
jgi:hypothetical protein